MLECIRPLVSYDAAAGTVVNFFAGETMPATRKQRAPSTYDVHPSLGMYQSSLAALKQKTGRSLEEWIKLVKKEAPATEKERRAWLKAEHGFGMNYAWW